MNDSRLLTKLILLLGAAGWSAEEIFGVFSEIKSSRFRSSEINEMLADFRRFRNHILNSSKIYYQSDTYRIEYVEPISVDFSDTAGKIERLLRVEAGMTNLEAVSLITRELKRLDPSRASGIPSYSKKSLASWVERLSKSYSQSEILHAATLIRNKYVHGADPDWRLRK